MPPIRYVFRFERSLSSICPVRSLVGAPWLFASGFHLCCGKLVSVGVAGHELSLGFSNFQQAMGVAIGPAGLAMGGPNLVWLLRDAQSLATKIDPPGNYDQGYLARESFVTGNIHVHELAWGERGELWLVNTLFSCLCTLHEDFNFVPRWQPPFVSQLAPQDRCHLNGLAMDGGRPQYVTALGVSDEPRGCAPRKPTVACCSMSRMDERSPMGFACRIPPGASGSALSA